MKIMKAINVISGNKITYVVLDLKTSKYQVLS